MQIIEKYFPDISTKQHEQLSALYDLYIDWNSKINVISRKDIENLYEHHVVHSMVISKWIPFVSGTRILDLGCGGGFPGIPLAILFPEVKFHMVDSIAKKLKVVDAVAEDISLKNIKTTHARVEDIRGQYDFVVTRAVADMSKLLVWIKGRVSGRHLNVYPNGLIALKGGKIYDEIKPFQKREYFEVEPLSDFYDEPFFKEKYLVYVQQ